MRLTAILFLFIIGPFMLYGQRYKPEDLEIWEPVPERIKPGNPGEPPSDAIILFDGSDLTAWASPDGSEPGWKVENGSVTVVKGSGDIQTKKEFGSIQLHIEWRAPAERNGKGQLRGNSGIFLQSKYEVQVLDCHNNPTYVNGMAGSVYKQHVPLANPCRPSGEWQVYDIIYTAPEFSDFNGVLVKPAYVTVTLNGVVVLNHVAIQGGTSYSASPEYTAHGKLPLRLQDHNDGIEPSTSFRNIWIRELD